MDQPLLPFGGIGPSTSSVAEPKGIVYTRPWVVELLLDLAGYRADADLVNLVAIEPAAGQGAFLIAMVRRLVASCRRLERPLTDCAQALIAYELSDASASAMRHAISLLLEAEGVGTAVAGELARGWVRSGDYLLDAGRLPAADYVIGNPPYVRLEDIPPDVAQHYRNIFPTMRGRADLYVAFFEAALRQLKPGGTCGYICADRWMLNQYGGDLRRMITAGFGVEFVLEMHNAQAFDDTVSAYPAITVIRRGPQAGVVVASAGSGVEGMGGGELARTLRSATTPHPQRPPAGLTVAVVGRWFTGTDPWPCHPPRRLALLRRVEDQFEPLESATTQTRVGIGVASGLDRVYVTREAVDVEESRLLPLAMAQDTTTGRFLWSGHRLVNPWQGDGMVDLNEFPRLRTYFERHQEPIRRRNVAGRNPHGWYRTIDRVNTSLTHLRKLYIPDIKDRLDPVLDRGETYPHHNLYFVVSGRWELEVLGGLLLSSIVQLFIEAYGVRMRGGYLRFQAQYLRRIRVPDPAALSSEQADRLIEAFRTRNRAIATAVAVELYRISPSEIEDLDGR